MTATLTLVYCRHFDDDIAEGTCRLCTPSTERPLVRRHGPEMQGASSYEKWIARRTQRQQDGELPWGFDSSDPLACWNAYNHWGSLEHFDEALDYLREHADTEAMRGFAVCLKLDGLGVPADHL